MGLGKPYWRINLPWRMRTQVYLSAPSAVIQTLLSIPTNQTPPNTLGNRLNRWNHDNFGTTLEWKPKASVSNRLVISWVCCCYAGPMWTTLTSSSARRKFAINSSAKTGCAIVSTTASQPRENRKPVYHWNLPGLLTVTNWCRSSQS